MRKALHGETRPPRPRPATLRQGLPHANVEMFVDRAELGNDALPPRPSVLAGRAIGPFHPPHSGEEAINLPAMEAAHKGNRVSLNAQPDAPIADANSIIATLTTQSLQGADLIQRRGFFNVRDRALDPTPNPRIAQLLHVREK